MANEYGEKVMGLEFFKPNDIVRIVIYDCGEGHAIVKSVEKDKMVAQWIWEVACYSCQTPANDGDLVEITENDIKMGVIHTLDLVERKNDSLETWVLSEEKITKLKDSYNSNKEDLEKLEDYIKDNGCTEDGLSDVTESFEQGWNNALEFVFGILEIR